MSTLMPKAQRLEWLLTYASDPYTRELDVCNRDFVNDYQKATNAQVDVMPYGADKCPMLGRDLSALHSAGSMIRYAQGLTDMRGMGFPAWVYSYRLRAFL